MSPDGQTKNQIGHVIINKRFRTSVTDTRVYRYADTGTIKLRLRKPPKEKVERRVKYNTTKLENEQVLKTFNTTLRNM